MPIGRKKQSLQFTLPCILDTDTPLKVKKYICCGMKLCCEKKLKHNVSLYTMAYNVSEGKRGCI